MAFARGNATDFIDFLRKLRSFAAGTASFALSSTGFTAGGTVPVGERWTILANGADMPALPGSGSATDGEVYLQGPGSDPADEIIVGFRTYRNAGNNLYGIEVRGYTSFDASLDFETLPSVSPPAYSSYDDAAFSFWFWVNGRRIMAVGRLGTTNILIHAGFIQQFGSRSQYPYPLLIAGSQTDQNQNFQANNFGQSCLPDPAHNSAWIRWVDGAWREVSNYANSNNDRAQAASGGVGAGYRVWPLRDPSNNVNSDADQKGNEEALFEQFNVSNTLQLSSSEVGVYSIYPAIIMSHEQLAGRIDGLFVIAGLGLVAGDTGSLGGDTYDIFTNTYRSEVVDYFAVLRE